MYKHRAYAKNSNDLERIEFVSKLNSLHYYN